MTATLTRQSGLKKPGTSGARGNRTKYGYDYSGNVVWRENTLTHADTNKPQLDEVYTYDSLNRLTNMERGRLSGTYPYSPTLTGASTHSQDWELDQVGNWISTQVDSNTPETRTYGPANQITSIDDDEEATGYDAAGNMTSGPRPGEIATKQHYVFDAWNRLVGVYADDGEGGQGDLIAAYAYDGQNHRVQKTLAGDPEIIRDYYYNEAWQVLEAREDGSPCPREQYVWDIRYVDAPIVRFYDGNTDGDYADTGDDVSYYNTDANFNVTALVDADTGATADRYVYGAYGKLTTYEPDWSDTRTGPSFGNEVLFTGQRFDPESALYLYRNRSYDTSLGRFLERDSAGYQDGMSLYQYVTSNPMHSVDTSGDNRVVVSGGISDDPQKDRHDWNWKNFVTAAEIRIKDYLSGIAHDKTPEQAEWIIFKPAYEKRAMATGGPKDRLVEEIEWIARKLGPLVRLRWFSTREEFIGILNTTPDGERRGFKKVRVGDKPMSIPVGWWTCTVRIPEYGRKEAPETLITDLNFYCHGRPGELLFDHYTGDEVTLRIQDIANIDRSTFAEKDVSAMSWACNTASPLPDKTTFTGAWRKRFGFSLWGVIGKTDYAGTAVRFHEWRYLHDMVLFDQKVNREDYFDTPKHPQASEGSRWTTH